MTQSVPKQVEPLDDQNVQQGTDTQTPSWFSNTYDGSSADDMAALYRAQRDVSALPAPPPITDQAAAYEAYRKRLEDRFASAQKLVDPTFLPQDNTALGPDNPFPQRPQRRSQGETRAAAPKAKTRILGMRPVTLAILSLTACSLGGVGGFVAANPDKSMVFAQRGLAFANSFWSQPIVAVTTATVGKKSIQTARLDVQDASGALNAPIPLDITAFPADAGTPVALKITGLPPAAYLTKGMEITKGEWLLRPADIAQAELVVPQTDVSLFALEVSVLDDATGLPAAPSQEIQVQIDRDAVPVPGVPKPPVTTAVIVPAAAVPNQGFNKQPLPDAIPVPLESVNPQAQSLITKGDALLKTGDILAARQFYLRAYELDVQAAAYGVGQTYDPAVYAKQKIKGLAPDAQAAAEWYGKAVAGGHEAAQAALAQLPAQP